MERFPERHQSRVTGVLSGFDRVLFRGTLRSISYCNGMDIFLSSQRVLYKNFSPFVERLSERLKEHARTLARREGRPFRYLTSGGTAKPANLFLFPPTASACTCTSTSSIVSSA